MTKASEYRKKAAEFGALAHGEVIPSLKAQLESLMFSYLRLADQAERNSHNDIIYETPRRSPQAQPAQQQQQPQSESKKDES